MKPQPIVQADHSAAMPANGSKVRRSALKPSGPSNRSFRMVVPLLLLLGASSIWAQPVRFRAAQIRITVPLNATDSTVITNLVTVENVATPVNLDVTGLPAGAGYTLSTNGLST